MGHPETIRNKPFKLGIFSNNCRYLFILCIEIALISCLHFSFDIFYYSKNFLIKSRYPDSNRMYIWIFTKLIELCIQSNVGYGGISPFGWYLQTSIRIFEIHGIPSIVQIYVLEIPIFCHELDSGRWRMGYGGVSLLGWYLQTAKRFFEVRGGPCILDHNLMLSIVQIY